MNAHHVHRGFGLLLAIIILALAIALGWGANELLVPDFAPTGTTTPPSQTPTTSDDTPQQPPQTPPEIPDEPPTQTNPSRPSASIEGLHQSCKQTRTCAQGQQCMSYYGYAGPNGPSFSTCEIPCKTDTDCPGTLSCGNYADGPGYVCSQF